MGFDPLWNRAHHAHRANSTFRSYGAGGFMTWLQLVLAMRWSMPRW
jgi:hypothetical protein